MVLFQLATHACWLIALFRRPTLRGNFYAKDVRRRNYGLDDGCV